MNPDPENPGYQTVEAEVPMGEMSSYTIDLRAMSQGRGSYTLKFIRYEEVPQMNQAKIIEDAKKDEEEKANPTQLSRRFRLGNRRACKKVGQEDTMGEKLTVSARVRALIWQKSIAIACVVLIHVASGPLLWEAPNTGRWMQSLLWGSASRFAVPLFFLCSGALLLDEKRGADVRHIWTRSIPHILITLFFWASAYAFAPLLYHRSLCRETIAKKRSWTFFAGVMSSICIFYILWSLSMRRCR